MQHSFSPVSQGQIGYPNIARSFSSTFLSWYYHKPFDSMLCDNIIVIFALFCYCSAAHITWCHFFGHLLQFSLFLFLTAFDQQNAFYQMFCYSYFGFLILYVIIRANGSQLKKMHIFGVDDVWLYLLLSECHIAASAYYKVNKGCVLVFWEILNTWYPQFAVSSFRLVQYSSLSIVLVAVSV